MTDTKKIILLRHAKSSWNHPMLDDHDRPLNKRGKAAAPVIARWLATHGYLPDQILCSSSARTRDTVRRMRRAVALLPKPRIEANLYHASPRDMRGLLRTLPQDGRVVMLVAHQPGLGSFAQQLADGSETSSSRRAFDHFPTAAAAVFEIDIKKWGDLEFQTARFVDFAMPRELINP